MDWLDVQRRSWNSDQSQDLEKRNLGHNRENSKYLKSLNLRKERARGTWRGLKTVGRIPLTNDSVNQHQQRNLNSTSNLPNQQPSGLKPLHHSPPRQIRDLSEAFPSLETESQRELLRQKAREANARMELEQEKLLQQTSAQNGSQSLSDTSGRKGKGRDRYSRTLSQDFAWDSERQIIREKNRNEKDRKKMIKRAQQGASSDLSRPNSSTQNWRKSFISSSSSNKRRSAISFKRKSFALGKSTSKPSSKSDSQTGQGADSTKFEMIQKSGSQPLTFDQQVVSPPSPIESEATPPVPPLPAYFSNKSRNKEVDEEMLETTDFDNDGKVKSEERGGYGYQFDWNNLPKRRIDHYRQGSDISSLIVRGVAPGKHF